MDSFAKKESKAVSWVLHSSVEEARYWHKRLTGEELDYCLSKESRITVRRMLQRELNRRVTSSVAKADIIP